MEEFFAAYFDRYISVIWCISIAFRIVQNQILQ